MKIKHILLPLPLLATQIACNSGETQQNQQEKAQKPNVLVILADDYGWKDASYNGSSFYETPQLDKLASQGVVFSNGYANCQVSSPSRASLMTGQFTARHGITDWIGARSGEKWREKNRHNQLLPAAYEHQLAKQALTLPEALKQHGYKTFFAGKWHLGGKGSWPENHGFDINVGGWDKGSPKGGYFSPWKNPNLPNTTQGENLTMRLARETARFIKENKDTSFFAYLAFYAVHSPIQTTREKWAKYRHKAEQNKIAEKGYEMGHFLPIRQVQDNPIYGGLVETMDDAIGIVLNELEKQGLAENTVVIFTSDNGGVAAGDAFSTSNKPLRAGKGYQFEGGIRVPFIIKAPEVEGGQTCATPVTGADLFPTILDLTGAELKPHDHKDGKSLLPLLRGEKTDQRPLIWHYPHYGNQGGEPSSIIRLGDWKLIYYHEDQHKELYNLKNDISEQNDLAAQNPGKVEELSKYLFDFLEETNALFPRKDPQYDAQKEREYLQKIQNQLLPDLERKRLEMLSPEFDPGNNWWGSQQIND